MFVLFFLLVRYPRMYSTPPPPEDDEEEAEDDTLVQVLQLPDALTFLSLIALSITLPMKLDHHLDHWSWNKTLFPLYLCFLSPLAALLLLLPLIGWRPIRYGMVKPFSQWPWWLDFATYTVAGPVWVYLLSLHLDGKTDAERLPWKEVWIPLLLINGVSAMTNLVFFNFLELVKDLAFSLPFNILVISKLSEKTKVDSWWHVMSGVFTATAFLPLYMVCLPSPRTSRFLIFCGCLAVCIPLLVFQIHLSQRLAWEDDHNQESDQHWPWKAIFGPVYAVEGMMMCPIMCGVLCTVAYNYRRERKRRQLEAAGGAAYAPVGTGAGIEDEESRGFLATQAQALNLGGGRPQAPHHGASHAQGTLTHENVVQRAERGMSSLAGQAGKAAMKNDGVARNMAKRAASHALDTAVQDAKAGSVAKKIT